MLSIITITKDDAAGLRLTVASTRQLRSSYVDIEQIVIDGSDVTIAGDNEKYCSQEDHVLYIKKDANGISDAFNAGIVASKHNWLWFLNGGDAIYSKLDLAVFTKLLIKIEVDLIMFQIALRKTGKILPFPSINSCFPPVNTWIPHPATLVQRTLFDRHGYFDSAFKIAMDYEFWIRIFTSPLSVNMISLPITSYDEEGISTVQVKDVNFEGMQVLRKHRWLLFREWLKMGRLMLRQYRNFKRHAYGR